jgi:hypothetical protein
MAWVYWMHARFALHKCSKAVQRSTAVVNLHFQVQYGFRCLFICLFVHLFVCIFVCIMLNNIARLGLFSVEVGFGWAPKWLR